VSHQLWNACVPGTDHGQAKGLGLNEADRHAFLIAVDRSDAGQDKDVGLGHFLSHGVIGELPKEDDFVRDAEALNQGRELLFERAIAHNAVLGI